MSKFQLLHEQFVDYLSFSPAKKHQKLLSILTKHKSYNFIDQKDSVGEETQTKQDKNTQELLKLVKKKKQQNQKIPGAQMNRTNFMISYMDKMKKQRKRQQKKKVNSCLYKRQGFDPYNKSIYMFLPNVGKISCDDHKKNNQSQPDKKVVTTINLFQSRGSSGQKDQRVRAISLQQKLKIIPRKVQEQKFQNKVQQVIEDIKKTRKKSKHYLSVFDQKSSTMLYFQNKSANKPTSVPKYHAQSLPEVKKIPQRVSLLPPPKQQKKIQRMPTFTSRQLQPWVSSAQLHDFNLSSQHQGIEEFNFY